MKSHNPLLPSACLVVDTNVLLLLLGYQCLLFQNAKPLERYRILNEIRRRADNISPERYDLLWRLFEHSARRVVTHHVIAETYGSRKRLATFRSQKDLVWRSVTALLKEHPGIEERPCSVRDLLERKEYEKILDDIGPSDAGVIFTAEQEKATIVTEDGTLAHWASARSVPVINLHQIGN